MKKRIVRNILICFLLLSISIPTYAQPGQGGIEVAAETKEISSGNKSRIYATPKGRLISSASLQISDEGNGMLGVYADTLCHEAVKQIYIDIFLDVWIESEQDWRTVDVYEELWNAADYPEGSLSMVYVSFDIDGLTKGLTYRLRGSHIVRGFGSLTETLSTSTSGIILG